MGNLHKTNESQHDRPMHRLRLTECDASLPEFPHDELSPSSLRAIAAVEDVSRRIEDLASSLGCLGFFDSSDGPRAA